MFAYFWNSENHLSNLTFWIELVGSLVEVFVVASYLFTFGKEPTEEVKKQREHRAEVFAFVAAIIVVTVVLGNHRIAQLQKSMADAADPLNQPVRSATARLRFSVREGSDVGRIDQVKSATSMLGFNRRDELLNKPAFDLKASAIEVWPNGDCFMDFALNTRIASFQPITEPVGKLLASLDKCLLWVNEIANAPSTDFEITSGIATLTFNSTADKIFVFPAQKSPPHVMIFIGVESDSKKTNVVWDSRINRSITGGTVDVSVVAGSMMNVMTDNGLIMYNPHLE